MSNSASHHFRRAALVAAVLPLEAFAHPGHDDHDVTWEFSHLAAHPLATFGCMLVIGAGAWAAWRLANRCATPTQKNQKELR